MVQISGGKRVLLLGSDGVVIYGPASGGVEREASLPWDLPNFDEQLVQVLSRQNNRPVLVLFDGADQTYRKEDNIPKLSPLDRARFVKRKLNLAFPNYPIRASLEVKPPKTKGRALRPATPSYLFVALPETDQIDRVARAILESGAPVGGFGLLPAESASLVPALANKIFAGDGRAPSRWSVLIGQHETGGLRQVVVKDGNLALTRLTPAAEGGVSGAAWSEEVIREFRATMTYISRFGYNPDDGIDVIIVCDDISRQFFSAAELGVERFRCMSVSDALKLIGAKSFGLDKMNFTDGLHAAWIAKKRQLSVPVRVPSLHKIMAPRLAAQLGSVGLAMAAAALVYMTFSSFQENYVLSQEIEQRQSASAMLERELADESKIFDTLPVKASLLRGTLKVKGMLAENTVPISGVMTRLKSSIGSDVQITNISYTHTPSPNLQLDKIRPTGAPSPAASPTRGLINMRFSFILTESMPLEQRVNRAEALQRSLQENFPGYTVTIAAQFGRVNRDGSFQGNLTGSAQPEAAVEAAEIVMEGPPL